MVINGMLGLGDNIYQRAFIKEIKQPVDMVTPWPELYADMPHVRPLMPATNLRTQTKNIKRQPLEVWAGAGSVNGLRNGYGTGGILAGMAERFGIKPGPMDLPDCGLSPVQGDYVVVRPVTLRKEWRADSRNPLPEYINAAAEWLGQHYTVVSVADLSAGHEWPVDDLPKADIEFNHGELDVMQLLALVSNARAVVGGVGWIVPAAIAANVPAWIVLGGHGAYNAPEKLLHPTQDCSHLSFAVPDNFCRCTDKAHRCDKRISDYQAQFDAWFNLKVKQ